MTTICIVNAMIKYNPKQSVELFHLLFLEQLGRKLDKKLCALKGGCNLRFFFKSIRYSEDIDLDVQIIAKETLRSKVNGILNSIQFKQILQTRKISINAFNEPKQTDTTQRWKLTLKTQTSQILLPTKIEFSRRGLDSDVQFSSIDPLILHEYALPPILVNHYSREMAIEQKINALIHRSQTQARDIFDLYLLMSTGQLPTLTDNKLISKLDIAKENAISMNFKDFKGQVLAYLPEEYQRQYDNESVWETIVTSVITALGSLL